MRWKFPALPIGAVYRMEKEVFVVAEEPEGQGQPERQEQQRKGWSEGTLVFSVYFISGGSPFANGTQLVNRQVMPKSGGGARELGITRALDRFIQQALLQVLQPRFDPSFSPQSYGFRPGKSAHQTAKAAVKWTRS